MIAPRALYRLGIQQPASHPVESKKPDRAQSTVILTERFAERRSGGFEDLEPGTKLGRYLIINPVGGGGMGRVYRAQDTELNRTVALKILPPHLCRHPEYLRRFRAEAQAQARLNSPHIITLYSFMELPAGEVLVLEYVNGRTLASRLRAQGPLPLDKALDILEQVLRGVEHMHKAGVVHRDLKPSNIFVTVDGAVKIMDFGVARILDQNDPGQTNAMVGTLLYISPEQINGRETDFRSDIYTLGVTLFETVTGRLPFERRTDYGLMHAHVQEDPPRPHVYQRRIPPELEWVILKAIEKDPARRFQTAAEFRAALLKLGVIERRHLDPVVPTPTAQASPEASDLRQEFWRYRIGARRPFLGGFGLDAGLLALAAALLFSLGILPPRKAPGLEPEPVVPQAAPGAPAASVDPGPPAVVNAPRKPSAGRAPVVNTAKPPAPAAVVVAPPAAPALSPPAPAPAGEPAPARDKYENLRQVWGE
jgi:serine/threonine-protein kinase